MPRLSSRRQTFGVNEQKFVSRVHAASFGSRNYWRYYRRAAQKTDVLCIHKFRFKREEFFN